MPRTHKSLARLFVESGLAQENVVSLERDHTNYLVNVLRKRVGDHLVLFNGRDGAWLAEIAAAGKKSTTITLREQIAVQPPAPDLWYGFAPLKSARLDYMVQKATEMGVGLIQPVKTQHTQLAKLKTERLRANAVEAAEQCEVLSVPETLPEISLASLIANWTDAHGDRLLVLADEEMAPASPVEALKTAAGRRLGLLIGPEGGFSEAELTLLRRQSFVLPISLGPRILRADTAAVAALALIQAIIGDWR